MNPAHNLLAGALEAPGGFRDWRRREIEGRGIVCIWVGLREGSRGACGIEEGIGYTGERAYVDEER